jgi:ADP-ribose pyrophosphatase
MPDPRIEVLDRTIAFDGHFQVVRYRVRHAQFAGGMGPVLLREVFARGHAAAVLPFDPLRDEVVLVEQFRIGALETSYDPWLLEPVAGIVEDGEGALEVARRETTEEAGLTLLDLAPVCSCFTSPGGSSEIVHVFVGRVETARAGGVFGLPDEGEDIRTHVIPFEQARAWLEDGRLHVATTVLALQWLALHHDALQARWAGAASAPALESGLRSG